MDLIFQPIVEEIPEEKIDALCNELEEALRSGQHNVMRVCNAFKEAIPESQVSCHNCIIDESLCDGSDPDKEDIKKKTVLRLLIKRLRSRLDGFDKSEKSK